MGFTHGNEIDSWVGELRWVQPKGAHRLTRGLFLCWTDIKTHMSALVDGDRNGGEGVQRAKAKYPMDSPGDQAPLGGGGNELGRVKAEYPMDRPVGPSKSLPSKEIRGEKASTPSTAVTPHGPHQKKKKKQHIFRYKVTTTDGVTTLYQRVCDVTAATGLSRYYVESFIHNLGGHETTQGKKTCAHVASIKAVHCDASGNEVPVIRRRPWFRA